MIQDSATAYPAITIVVPVYRDLKVTRACLESLISSNLPRNASVVVINDCSPEEELSVYLTELAVRFNFRLVVNDSNFGFVRSANKGFALGTDTDILLLNSDT